MITLTPFVWMIAASFMRPGEANAIPPHLLPHKATLEHYVALFTRLDLARHFVNSAVITVTATILSLLINAMAGYAFAKLRFGGRERIFRSLMLALVIPAQVGMLPLFLLLREMGFVNTYVGVMIPYLSSVLGIFMIRQYVLGVPDELLDAARVDGAGEFRIFWTIVVPVVEADPGHARGLHVPERLERLHVAADRAERQSRSTRCPSRSPTWSASTCRTPS